MKWEEVPWDLQLLVWSFVWERRVRYPTFVGTCSHPFRHMTVKRRD